MRYNELDKDTNVDYNTGSARPRKVRPVCATRINDDRPLVIRAMGRKSQVNNSVKYGDGCNAQNGADWFLRYSSAVTVCRSIPMQRNSRSFCGCRIRVAKWSC